jgi:hypothetical protein
MNNIAIKEKLQNILVSFSVFIFTLSAVGYLFFPSKMLGIVGIESNLSMDFLARALGAALLAFIPVVWMSRHRDNTAVQRRILIGLMSYMVFSSAVDAYASLQHIVGTLSLPSIALRIILAVLMAWLIWGDMQKEDV